jgi:hypothetical protein
MKRAATDDDTDAAVNILSKLPYEVVLYMIETTQMAIADIFLFCQTDIWTFSFCNDSAVWKRIYIKRFSDAELRRRVEGLFPAASRELTYTDNARNVVVTLLFTPYDVNIGALTGFGNIIDTINSKYAVIGIINQICGPPDSVYSVRWTRDFGILKDIFYRMITYKMVSAGFEPLIWAEE